MMPGSEIGNTTSKEIASRPKKSYRPTANANAVPKTNAINVAEIPAITDHPSASLTPVFTIALFHQLRVRSLGGQLNVRLALKELIITTVRGI